MKELDESRKKGYLTISLIIILSLILGNYFLSCRVIINRNKRLQSLFKNINFDSRRWNVEKFTYDELDEMDKKISSGEYKNILDLMIRVNGESKLWLENSKTISENGFIITRIRYRYNDIYKIENGKECDFYKLLKGDVNYSFYSKKYEVYILKEYMILDQKLKSDKKLRIRAKIELFYQADNTDVIKPNSVKIKEITIEG